MVGTTSWRKKRISTSSTEPLHLLVNSQGLRACLVIISSKNPRGYEWFTFGNTISLAKILVMYRQIWLAPPPKTNMLWPETASFPILGTEVLGEDSSLLPNMPWLRNLRRLFYTLQKAIGPPLALVLHLEDNSWEWLIQVIHHPIQYPNCSMFPLHDYRYGFNYSSFLYVVHPIQDRSLWPDLIFCFQQSAHPTMNLRWTTHAFSTLGPMILISN